MKKRRLAAACAKLISRWEEYFGVSGAFKEMLRDLAKKRQDKHPLKVIFFFILKIKNKMDDENIAFK